MFVDAARYADLTVGQQAEFDRIAAAAGASIEECDWITVRPTKVIVCCRQATAFGPRMVPIDVNPAAVSAELATLAVAVNA